MRVKGSLPKSNRLLVGPCPTPQKKLHENPFISSRYYAHKQTHRHSQIANRFPLQCKNASITSSAEEVYKLGQILWNGRRGAVWKLRGPYRFTEALGI